MLLRIAQPILLSIAVLVIIILPHSAPIRSSNQLEAEMLAVNSLRVYINQTFVTQAIEQTIYYNYPDQQVLEIVTNEFSLRFILNAKDLQKGLYAMEQFNGNVATIHFKNGCYATTDHYFSAILNLEEINFNEIQGSFTMMAHAETCDSMYTLQKGEFKSTFKRVVN